MSDNLDALRRQLGAAADLKSVVRAMKALAASSLGEYEKSVLSLRDYSRAIEQGLIACGLQSPGYLPAPQRASGATAVGIVIFGSDQGLVGQFNEIIAEFLQAKFPGSTKLHIWAIGERVADTLTEKGFEIQLFELPTAIQSIGLLIGHVLVAIQGFQEKANSLEIHVIRHRPTTGSTYEPYSQLLLPLDKQWWSINVKKWPTNQIPQTIAPPTTTFAALVREYIFVSLFQACAESLASENASRLVGMQRAEKNIDELSLALTQQFHRLRQSSIDEELFDVVSGFQSLSPRARPHGKNDINTV